MGAYATLRDHLAEWAGDDAQRRAIAETVTNIAQACVEVAAPCRARSAGK